MEQRNENRQPEKGSPPPPNLFEDLFFSLVAGLALVFWDLTTRRWLLGTYTNVRGEGDGQYREGNQLNITLGVLFSLLAGIGAGYNMGWLGGAPFLEWASYSLLAAAGTAVYGWTIIYMILVRRAFRLSEKLWSHVNIDATYDDYYGQNGRRNPAWFSKLLMFAATVAVVLSALALDYAMTCYVQAHQEGWGWLGWISGVFLIIVMVVVVIAVFIMAAEASGGFAFVLFLALFGAGYYFWGGVSGFLAGLYNNLTGDGPWGAWGYVPGAVAGTISGIIFGGAAGGLLWHLRLRLIAAVAGLYATYCLAPYSDALVSTIALGPLAFLQPILPWLAYGVELLAIIGFAIPATHIVITHGLRKLANIFDLWDEVYWEERGGYREFFLQGLNIVMAGLVIWLAPAVVSVWLGLESIAAIYGLAAAAALVSYVVVGRLLDRTGIWPFAVAVSGCAGLKCFAFYAAHFTAFGMWGAAGAGVLAFLATMALGFPLPYAMVRWVLDRAWLAGAVRGYLVNAHERVCQALADLLEELFEAADKTYGDDTPYREVAVHLTNIFLSLAVLGGTLWAGGVLGVAAWLTNLAAALLTLTSYGVAGRALLRWGVWPVSFVISAGLGVLFGVYVHGALPEAWGGYRYAGSVPGGIFGAAVVFGAGYPFAYLFARWVINFTCPERWLRPALVGMYDWYTKLFGRFRARFMVKYRLFQERLAQARARFAERYALFQERFNARGKR